MSEKIDFYYHWLDGAYLGELSLVCPHCKTTTKEDVVEIDEDIIICSKCGAKFKAKAKLWIEEVQTNNTDKSKGE